MKYVIYHSADFDGKFCEQIARLALGELDVKYIGWNYGDPEPGKEITPQDEVYILDLNIPSLMDHPKLVWIDHHKTAIEKYPSTIKGYRIDGVAACRLAWQWFMYFSKHENLPPKGHFLSRRLNEPRSVQLAGEYDVWDKRNPNCDIFQHGLRSCDLAGWWEELLTVGPTGHAAVSVLLERGKYVQYATERSNESVIKAKGFTLHWEGLTFLALNTVRCNSHSFTAGLRPEHEALIGFGFDGKKWLVSLYGVPGKPEIDLSAIAVRYGGGGHKQACGFECRNLPFTL
jgi:hypothetical protein